MRNFKSLSVPELLLELELESTASFAEVESAFMQQVTAWDPTMPPPDDDDDLRALERFPELRAVFAELRRRWPAWESAHQRSYDQPLELEPPRANCDDFSREYSTGLLKLKVQRWALALACFSLVIGLLASLGFPGDFISDAYRVIEQIN